MKILPLVQGESLVPYPSIDTYALFSVLFPPSTIDQRRQNRGVGGGNLIMMQCFMDGLSYVLSHDLGCLQMLRRRGS